MLKSMTAYATRAGAHGPFSWTWEVRGVNGKGLDLRLRAPDWIDGIEPAFKAALKGKVGRGTLQVSLRVTRTAGSEGLSLDDAAVSDVLAALARIEDMAPAFSFLKRFKVRVKRAEEPINALQKR